MRGLVRIFVIVALLGAGQARASESPSQVAWPELQISSQDRILILAPHPDDEVIAAGGLIQKAVEAGIPLKIVYLTNGDNNAPSFIINQKRLVIRQKAVLAMGQLRANESVKAVTSLGVKPDQLVFLGYPDWGTERMFTSFWGQGKPYRGMMTRVRKVPYTQAMSFGAPFDGQSVLRDLHQIIESFRPTKIFVSHPLDLNRDHRALPLYVQVTLWDLADEIQAPELFGYVVHAPGWPVPRGYHENYSLDPPESWNERETRWFKLPITVEQQRNKRQAISYFHSQISYNPRYLYTFARTNELFARLEPQVLPKGREISLNRQDTIFYSVDDQNVYIRIKKSVLLDLRHVTQFYVAGYKHGVPFDQMPKLRVIASSIPPRLTVIDRKKVIEPPGLKVEQEKGTGDRLITVPLKAIHQPDKVMISIQISPNGIREHGAWRIFELPPN